jgi:hypothetical protein
MTNAEADGGGLRSTTPRIMFVSNSECGLGSGTADATALRQPLAFGVDADLGGR